MKLPISVTVLTGFLGSGKTTLLKALLQHKDMAKTAVIVNEFGDVGIDDALIAEADDDVVLLPSGCVCCEVRGDLVVALNKLCERMTKGEMEPVERVVIETTGLADPAPIAHTLITEEDLFRVFQLDAIVTTVDGELGLAQIEEQYEPAKQIAVADRIVITKGDRTDGPSLARLESRIRALNPAAEILRVVSGAVEPKAIIGLGAFEPIAAKAHAEGWLAAERYQHDPHCHDPHCHHPGHDHGHDHTHDHGHDHGHGHDCGPDCGHDHHHDNAHAHGHQEAHHTAEAPRHLHGVRSFALAYDTPLDGKKLSLALELIRSAHGEKLLRIKGIVHIQGQPVPFVIHGVQHVFYPPAPMEKPATGGATRSRLVFITKDLDEATISATLDPLLTGDGPADLSTWRAMGA